LDAIFTVAALFTIFGAAITCIRFQSIEILFWTIDTSTDAIGDCWGFAFEASLFDIAFAACGAACLASFFWIEIVAFRALYTAAFAVFYGRF